MGRAVGAEVTQLDLIRFDDWRARFDAACDALRLTPFSWGKNDCAVGLAGNLTLALTGVDVAAAYRDRYRSRKGALAVLRASRFSSLGDLVASLLPEHEHHSLARVGDVVVIPDYGPIGEALGVVNGERVFVMMDGGFGTVDRALAIRAFRVG